MSRIYTKFLKMNIDTVAIGLELGEDDCNYFCTPKGAKIIARTGVDGIHYCFLPGFGETVFAVSPMNTPGNYVHPLAKTFEDFLRLLMSCGNTAAMDQAYRWEKCQFEDFINHNSITEEQQQVLEVLSKKFSLTPIDEPFTYIKELQSDFDYNSIKFTKDYYDFLPSEEETSEELPEWKVYFNGNFWGHDHRERAGKEIPIHRKIVWGDRLWYIPAIYICSKGLVVDFCMQVPTHSIEAFMEKWNLSLENDCPELTKEQQMQIEAENPMTTTISPVAFVNGKELTSSHGCGICWNPCFLEHNGIEAEGVVKQYDLDPTFGWNIWRSAFPWATKRKPKVDTLSMLLREDSVAIPGPQFYVSAPGQCIGFTHPTTGVEHTLTVQEYEKMEMPEEQFGDTDYEYPTHYVAMSYTLYPEISDTGFTVIDSEEGHRPRKKEVNPMEPEASADCAVIGIIGGADGAAVIAFGGDKQGILRAACSSLYFNPTDTIKWQIVFYEKRYDDMTVNFKIPKE